MGEYQLKDPQKSITEMIYNREKKPVFYHSVFLTLKNPDHKLDYTQNLRINSKKKQTVGLYFWQRTLLDTKATEKLKFIKEEDIFDSLDEALFLCKHTHTH